MRDWPALLPYDTLSNNLDEIISGISYSIQSANLKLLQTHLKLLHEVLKHKIKLPPATRLSLLELIFLIVTEDIPLDPISTLISIFRKLSKKSKLKAGAITLDPIRLLNKIQTGLKSQSSNRKLERKNILDFIDLAKSANRFFKPDAVSKIMETLVPELNIHNLNEYTQTIGLMTILIPTWCKPTINYTKFLLQQWAQTRNDALDTIYFDFFSRLVKDQSSNINLTIDDFEMIFCVGQRFLDLTHQKHHSKLQLFPSTKLESFATLIIYALNTNDTFHAFKSLKKLIQIIETFAHPSNVGSWSRPISTFIKELTTNLHDRHLDLSDPEIAPENKLDHSIFVNVSKILLPIVDLIMFGKLPDCVSNSLQAFKKLAQIIPDQVVSKFLLTAVPALQNVYESHRTYSVIQGLDAISSTLVNESKDIVGLLFLILPGIDINDIPKSISSLFFIQNIVSHIVIADCSKSHEDDQQMHQLKDSTAGFEEWLPLFLNRIFTIFENLPENFGIGSKASAEEYFLYNIIYCCQTIFTNISPTLETLCLDIIFRKSQSNIPTATNAFGSLCGSIATNNPFKKLKRFFANSVAVIKDEIESGSGMIKSSGVLSTHPFMFTKMSDANLHWHQSILKQIVYQSGTCLLNYKVLIEEVLDSMFSLGSFRGYTYSGEFMVNVVKSLVYIYPLNVSNHRTTDWEQSYKLWGKTYDINELNCEWHIPNEDEISFACYLVEKYSLLAIKELREMKMDLKENRLDVLKHLSILNHCIQSSGNFTQPLKTDENFVFECGFLFTKGDAYDHWRKRRDEIKELLLVIGKELLDSDDIDACISVVNCIKSLVVDKSSRVSEFKMLYQYQKRTFSKPNSLHPRSLLLRKLQITHLHRVQHNLLVIDNYEDLCSLVVDLSISKYAKVRINAQSLLTSILTCHKTVKFQTFERLMQVFRKNAVEDELKGSLYLLCAKTPLLGLYVYDWKYTLELFKGILQIQHVDKPSILNLVGKLFSTFVKLVGLTKFETILSKQILSNPLTAIDPEKLETLLAKEKTNAEEARNAYKKIIETALEFLKGGNQWRFVKLTLGLFDIIINKEFEIDSEVVDIVFKYLLNEHPEVRMVAIGLVTSIFKTIKKKNVKNVISKGEPGFEPMLKRLKYIKGDNQRVFIDKPNSWMYPPRQVLFFEASKAVAKSDSTEIQQKISEYMNSESFWSEFLDLQSQDIGFRANLADFYTRVFQSTSPKILPFIRKLLLGDVQSQRAASEILSGIIRASKQYSNEDLDLLDEVYEIIISAMENATHETYHIWINCLMYFTKNRDPNRFQRLIERLGNVEEFGTESFVVARKIMWAQILILAFKGRLYLNVLPKVVWSPYEQVRGASGRLIDTCLHFREIGFLDFDDLLKSNGFELENEAVIEKLFFDLKTWKQLPQNETGNSLYSNAIKTVLCWFQSALKTSIAASIEPFLPTLLKLTLETCAQDYSDPDLLEMSSLVLKQYPLFQHSPKTLSRTIQILIKSCNSSWHIKTKVLTIVEHLFFTHVLLITPLNKNEILTLLKTLLEDQQLEVRIQAGNTLSYVIRCSDESVISDLKDEYMKLMKQKLPLKKDVSAQEYQKLIIKRHGVVMAISALILAFPYDMPNWMTSLLVEMAGCFNEPGVISSSVMSVFREFKRTHMDNWEGEKTKFTEEELEAISDLLYSPGYYA